jgi:benzoylformate decarboxylase
VEEAVTTGYHIRERLRIDRPGHYHRTIGGGLGWGIGAAVGAQLGSPDHPVVALLGDGSAMFGVQGLWSAARYGAAVTFVVLNNAEYRVLKDSSQPGAADAPGGFVGMDLSEPSVDWVALGASFGLDALRVDDAGHLPEAMARAQEASTPTLIDVPISGFATTPLPG